MVSRSLIPKDMGIEGVWNPEIVCNSISVVRSSVGAFRNRCHEATMRPSCTAVHVDGICSSIQ